MFFNILHLLPSSLMTLLMGIILVSQHLVRFWQEESMKMRLTLLRCIRIAVNRSSEDAQTMLAAIQADMADDPTWQEMYGEGPIDFDRWQAYMSDQSRFGTHSFIVAFASTHAIDVEVWQDAEDKGHPQLFWREGISGGSPIRVLRKAQHYDLLILKRRLRQKTG